MTQKQIIKTYLESFYPDWIREFEVYRINTEFGFVGPRGCRDIREMLADGEIEGELRGKYRWVRAKSIIKIHVSVGFHDDKLCKDKNCKNYIEVPDPSINLRPEIIEQRRVTENQKSLL